MTPDMEVKRGRYRRAIVFIAVSAIICCAAPGMNISAEPVMPPIPPLPTLAPEHATYIQVGRCSWYWRWHRDLRLGSSPRRFSVSPSRTRGGLDSAHTEIFYLHEVVDAVFRALAADAGFLHAAEGRDLGRDDAGVDAHDPGFEPLGDAPYA